MVPERFAVNAYFILLRNRRRALDLRGVAMDTIRMAEFRVNVFR